MPGWFSRRSKVTGTVLGGIGGGLVGAAVGALLGFIGPQLLIIAGCMTAVTSLFCGLFGISDQVVKAGLIVGGFLGCIAAAVTTILAGPAILPIMAAWAGYGAITGAVLGASAGAVVGYQASGQYSHIPQRPSARKESDDDKQEQQDEEAARSQNKAKRSLEQTDRQDSRVRHNVRGGTDSRRRASSVELTDMSDFQDSATISQGPAPTIPDFIVPVVPFPAPATPAPVSPAPVSTFPAPASTSPAAHFPIIPQAPIRIGISEVQSADSKERRESKTGERSLDIQFHSEDNIRKITDEPENTRQGWEPQAHSAHAPVVFRKKDTDRSFEVHPDKIITNDNEQVTFEAMLRAFARSSSTPPIINTVQRLEETWRLAFKAVYPSETPKIITHPEVKAQPAAPRFGASPS